MSTILDPDNRLFVLARTGQRQPSALVAVAVVFVALVFSIAGQILARLMLRSIVVGGESATDPIAEGASGMFLNSVGFLPIYLCVRGWLALFSKHPFWTLGYERDRPLSRALGAALVAVLMATAVTIVLAMLPRTALAPGQFQTIGLAVAGSGLLTTAVLLIGIGIIAVRTHRDARNDRTREPLIAS